jgi:hypothetical protein
MLTITLPGKRLLVKAKRAGNPDFTWPAVSYLDGISADSIIPCMGKAGKSSAASGASASASIRHASPGPEPKPAAGFIDLKSLMDKLETSHELMREAGEMESQRLRQILLVNEELARDMIEAEMEVDRNLARQKELLREVADKEKRCEQIKGQTAEAEAARAGLSAKLERESAVLEQQKTKAAEQRESLEHAGREIGTLKEENARLEQRVVEARALLGSLQDFREKHRRMLEKHLKEIDERTEGGLAEGNT